MDAPTLVFCACADAPRLDRFLCDALGGAHNAGGPSRAACQQLIGAGRVQLAERVVGRPGHKVRRGQQLAVQLVAPTPSTLVPHPMALQVLYEDHDLLVINKPAHLAVHPGAGTKRPTLVHGLLAHCTDLSGIGGVLRPGIVHRLDAGTTGVMVVAKHDAAHRHLADQFAARTTDKRYLALVYAGAALAPGSGRIQTPYGRHPVHRRRFTGGHPAAGARARRASTEWQVVAKAILPDLVEAGPLAVVGCRLHTGRTHQLRVHLSELGCPIVGDATYGGRRAQTWPGQRAGCASLAGLDHQALHAWRLSFTHPGTGARLTFVAPLPPSWGKAAALLHHAASGDAALSLTKEIPCA